MSRLITPLLDSPHLLWEYLFAGRHDQLDGIMSEALAHFPAAFTRVSIQTLLDLCREWEQALTGYEVVTKSYKDFLSARWTAFRDHEDVLCQIAELAQSADLSITEAMMQQPIYLEYLRHEQLTDNGIAKRQSRGIALQEACISSVTSSLSADQAALIGQFDDMHAYTCEGAHR